ncbi:methyltransferase domain-containing protein [Cryptosporangium japonicum]|uniref:Class I SAM-dependent methyltransferase n=1 Tax=Cryptosporangium japonicum TaxID=80872 RepID=A0ABP3D7E2_9ACTN
MDASIRTYYERGGELTRLDAGNGKLEFLRTQEILRRVLPPGPVLDVGGATGVHARWLAADGHPVRLVDPLASHVAHAASIPGVDAVRGDARRLDEPTGAYAATLLLGPLYHLTERADRVAALREAVRVTAPGGVVVAATIARHAGLWDAVARDRYARPAVRRLVDVEVATGVHDGLTEELFTLAYFHTADEIRDEFAEAGMAGATRYAVEGPAWLFAGRDGWLDDERTASVLAALRIVEQDESQFGATSHLLTVGRRPASG